MENHKKQKRHRSTQSMKKESKWPKRGRKDMWKRESQDRVETESEKGKMSNEQEERVTISSQREKKRGRQDKK